MVKAFILSEHKSKYSHHITILVIMKHDSWIQELSFWYDDKKFSQTTTLMNKEELENIAKAMRGSK